MGLLGTEKLTGEPSLHSPYCVPGTGEMGPCLPKSHEVGWVELNKS